MDIYLSGNIRVAALYCTAKRKQNKKAASKYLVRVRVDVLADTSFFGRIITTILVSHHHLQRRMTDDGSEMQKYVVLVRLC